MYPNKPLTRYLSTHSVVKTSHEDRSFNNKAVAVESLNDLWVKIQGMFAQSNAQIEAKIESSIAQLGMRIDGVETQLAALKCESTTHVNNVAEVVNEIRYEIEVTKLSMGRLERSEDLIISGIPYVQNEDLNLLFRKIATSLAFNEPDKPMVDLKRLSKFPISSGSSPPIVCQFAQRNARNDFYRIYLQHRNISLRVIGFDSDNRIYITENLTPEDRAIRAEAIKLKKNGRLKKVYTKDGIVYANAHGSTEAEAFYTLEQLNAKFC